MDDNDKYTLRSLGRLEESDDDCVDNVVSQFSRKHLGGLYSRNEYRQPRIRKRKLSRYLRVSGSLDVEVIEMLDKTKCPFCGFKPDPFDTLVYVNPLNNQISWFCTNCRDLGLLKYDLWHRLPGYKRKSDSLETESEILCCIIMHNGSNINQLKDILGWSYGKTRGACNRLVARGEIRIEEVNENGYRESRIFLISPVLN